MTYSEKLKDPRWQKKRLKILERDNWKCSYCGNKEKTLHVHHIRYDGEPWEQHDKFLETLCEDCHDIEHGKADDFLNDILQAFKDDGYSNIDLVTIIYPIVNYAVVNGKRETIKKIKECFPEGYDKLGIKRST